MNPYTLYPLTDPQSTVFGSDVSTLVYKLVDKIVSAAAALDLRITRWNKRRKAIAELSVLSDHILRDIGVSRSEISAAVDGLLDAPKATRASRPRLVAEAKLAAPTAVNDNVAGLAA